MSRLDRFSARNSRPRSVASKPESLICRCCGNGFVIFSLLTLRSWQERLSYTSSPQTHATHSPNPPLDSPCGVRVYAALVYPTTHEENGYDNRKPARGTGGDLAQQYARGRG